MWDIVYSRQQLVSSHQGTLPLLLTCPHGGDRKPKGVPVRESTAPGCAAPNIQSDLFTREITTRVAQAILETVGEAPYVVMAEYHRQYIDANRPETCAFEPGADAAEPFYSEYQDTIRSFVDEIRSENDDSGLLLDIHGTVRIAEDPADVYFGTDDGKTVSDHLALFTRRSLRGLLTAAEYSISPAQPDIKETSQVSGGFTVQTYGSSHSDGIDAIQLEISDNIRKPPANRKLFIEHLARAISSLSIRLFP